MYPSHDSLPSPPTRTCMSRPRSPNVWISAIPPTQTPRRTHTLLTPKHDAVRTSTAPYSNCTPMRKYRTHTSSPRISTCNPHNKHHTHTTPAHIPPSIPSHMQPGNRPSHPPPLHKHATVRTSTAPCSNCTPMNNFCINTSCPRTPNTTSFSHEYKLRVIPYVRTAYVFTRE